jgi:hypothetical protein
MTKWITLASVLVAVLWGALVVAGGGEEIRIGEECVDIKLAAEIVPGERGDVLKLCFYAGNCGPEPGVATVTATAGADGKVVGSVGFNVSVPAQQHVKQSLAVPLPPGTPPGCYTLCLEAELGTAYDATCATVTIDGTGRVLGFYPHESTPGGVSMWSWGEIKAGYK